MTKKILFMAGHSRSEYKHRMVAEAMKCLLDDPENEVYYLDCGGILRGYCGLCQGKHFGYCKRCYPKCLEAIKKAGFDEKNIIKLKKVEIPKFPDFKSIEETIEYNYEGYNLGLGPVSCIMTITKDYNFDIKKWNKRIKYYFETVYTVLKNIEELDETYNFDLFYTFNGRMPFAYAPVTYARSKNKPFLCFTSGSGKNRKRVLLNTVPHDFDNIQKEIKLYWERTPESEREKLAEEWFEKKRQGKYTYGAIYTKNQLKNALPKNFDSTKYNIAIFNTSSDEVAAFKNWGHPFAKNENEVLKQLFEHYKENSDIHFYLRIHPNLQKAKRHNTTQIRELFALKKKYKNVTIIDPNDKVDTYALVQAADKILTTYSTTGAEAAYMGKTVITMGKAVYDKLDCTYVAHSQDEIYELIENKELAPKPKENALPLGCYYSVSGDEYKYFRDEDWKD